MRLEVAARHNPVDLDWVIANLEIRRVDPARERAAVLAKWPNDPRLAPALLRLLPRTNLTGRTSRPFWTAVFRIIHRQFHDSVGAAIADLDKAELDGQFGEYVDMKLRTLRRRIEGLAAEPRLDAETARLLAALHTKLEIGAMEQAAKSVEEFVREIWASPQDDGLREVFADWLIARGDPRGEFIMLQMTKQAAGARPRSLKRETRSAQTARARVDGGARARLDQEAASLRGRVSLRVQDQLAQLHLRAMTHPAWSTVREYSEGATRLLRPLSIT